MFLYLKELDLDQVSCLDSATLIKCGLKGG